jgi:manganese transport protein
MIPAVIVVAMGVDSTQALVLSQVVLSLVLPVPMIALLVLSGRRDVMGSFANRRLTQVVAIVAAVVVVALNLLLLLQTAGVQVSFLGSN